MKICFVNSFYSPDQIGGAEESVKILAESLLNSGHDAFVISTGELDSEELVEGVRVYRVAVCNIYGVRYQGKFQKYFNFIWHCIDTYNFPTMWKVNAIIRKENPDIVHTNNLKGISVAIWSLAKRHGIPIVHTLRDYYLLCPKATMFCRGINCQGLCTPCSVYSYGRRLLSSNVDSVVGISNFILQRHLVNGFFPKAKTNVVFNAFKPTQIELPPRLNGESLVVGYIGRLSQFKGVDLLLEEFSLLKEGGVTLLLAGTGEHVYEASIKNRFSSTSICFEGYLAPNDFFRRIDVLVVPSLWHEPLGRVVFEAYAHGVPVIASTRGGIPEIVNHGETGLLFNPDKSGSISDALHNLQVPNVLEKMKHAAILKSKDFLPQKIAESYLNIFTDLNK